jgi:polar amino acid transport system substrate-binding protein
MKFKTKIRFLTNAKAQRKKTINIALRFFIVIFLNISFFAVAVELTLAYEDKEQPPYYMGNSLLVKDDKPGVSVDIINRLGEMIDGLEINLVRCPWKRCLNSLQNNSIDGVFNASYKNTRLALGWYPTVNNKLEGPVDITKRITFISYSFYKLKNTNVEWDGESINHLQQRTIGAPFGYSIVGDLRKKGFVVDESPSTKSNLEKLLLRRVDLVALQGVTADSLIQSNPKVFANIEKLYPAFITKAYYLMLSHGFVKNHPEIAQEIWDTLKIIRETEFDQIVSKYADN